jgi:hypothetical protein
MRIYISGPVTGTEDYMARFQAAEHKLEEKGYTVINPAKVNAELPDTLAHNEYMVVSLAMMELCDAVYMMDGWQESKGCSIEFEHAFNNGLAIVFEYGNEEILNPYREYAEVKEVTVND